MRESVSSEIVPGSAERIRHRLVRLTGVLGVVVPLLLAVVDHLRGNVEGVIWKLFASAAVSVSWVLFLRFRSYTFFALAFNAMLLVHLAFASIDDVLLGYLWLFLMPPFTFFVAGLRAGTAIGATSYLFTLGALLLRPPPQVPYAVPDIAVGLLLLYVLCWFYEYVRSRYEAELNQAAVTDQLTGIWNRRHFERSLVELIPLSARHALPLSLVLFDIDHFKRINDELGHPAGDEVLRKLAEGVSRTLRASDVFARLGGDEFAIIAPGTASEDGESESPAGGVVLARRVLDAVEAIDFGLSLPVRISAGLTQFRRGDSVESLYQRADAALYEAKQQGRGRIVQSAPR